MTDATSTPSHEDSPARRPESLRVLGIVDLHWGGKGTPELPETDPYDLVLVAGDLTNFLGVEHAQVLLDRLRASGTPLYAVCGNCDLPEIEQYLESEGIGLDRRAAVHDGVCLAGLSGGLPFGDLPYERTEAEYEQACRDVWHAVSAADPTGELPVILVSHQPAHGTECDIARGNHVGSKSIRQSIEAHHPDLVFSGHIHESVGEGRLGTTRLVNPGPWFEGRWVELAIHREEPAGKRIELQIQQRSS